MTIRTLAGLTLVAGLAAVVGPAPTTHAQPPLKLPAGDDTPAPKFPPFESVVKGAKVHEGLFTLHLKDDRLYAEIQPFQFDKPFLFAAAIAKGAGAGGMTLVGDEAPLLYFKRVGDRVFLVRKNTRFRAQAGTPAGKATDTTYSDSVLMSLPIRTLNPMKGSVVVDFNQIFFTDFAETGIGYLDTSRTTWGKIKTFKKNVELEVEATFGGNRRGGGDDVIDSRGTSITLHYSLVELPEFGYSPRHADDRVGHFTSVLKDFNAAEKSDTAFVRYVNRWRLERADGSSWKEGGKLQPPKKNIVFYIEDSVPHEFRAVVREGILEWNKAFEKIGFRNAIEVRQQEPGDEFDPEDISYATFRWVTNDQTFAIGPSRVNPMTGEIIDADILFDASMVRYEKAAYRTLKNEKGEPFEPASAIQAAKRGWTLPADPLARLRGGWNDRAQSQQPQSPEEELKHRLAAIRHGFCQCGTQKTNELGLAVAVLAAAGAIKDGEKVPDELLQQAVKETVMHEVGHTLGLRHNFKASTLVPNDKLHDTAYTANGLVGSIMDYNPANIAPKGVKQGFFFSPTIGPYDYWAIEYAYAPVGDDELKKIASKAADPKLTYATDEDLYSAADPLVNQWDMGGDPLRFAQDRIKVAQELMPKLADAVVDSGEGYQRVRSSFGQLLGQYGNAAMVASQFVGGEMMHRDHKGDKDARDPFVPVPAVKQREALKFVGEQVLTDKPFDFPPELLRKLAADRWIHWGNEEFMRRVDFNLNDRVLNIHRVALGELLSGATLKRIQENALKGKKDESPLTMAEVFRTITDSAFADLPADGKPSSLKSSVVRRNLQREYLSRLNGMVLGSKGGSSTSMIFILLGGGGGSVPADAKSLARFHLKEIQARIDGGLKAEPRDELVKAYLSDLKEQVAKVLSASMTVND